MDAELLVSRQRDDFYCSFCNLRFRPQDSSLSKPPFLHVPSQPFRSLSPALFPATSHPVSDPPPLLVCACAGPLGRSLLTLPSSRSLRSAGGRGLWEKMAAAAHPRVARVLPMSRKCHRENGPGLGFRDRVEVLGVAPCCSGHADALGTLDFLDPGLRPVSFSFPSRLRLTNSKVHLGRGSALGEREQRAGERRK